MTAFDYLSSTITKYRAGTIEDPYVPINESKKIINNQIQLSEIPVRMSKVQITGFTEVVEPPEEGLLPDQYKVDYNEGIVQFHPSKEGRTVACVYQGRGNHFVSAARVWIEQSNGEVTKTLYDVTAAASSFYHAGMYDPAVAYEKYNIVNYRGGSYIAIRSTIGNDPVSTVYWRKLTGFQWRGTYSSSAVYVAGDFVSDSSSQSIYTCIAESSTNVPLTNSSNWSKVMGFDALIATVNASVTNANQAASAANTAKDSANTAAAGANNAATAANTAAAQANAAHASIQNAETLRVNAEESRVSQEISRMDAEADRAGQESVRNTSETARKNAETARANAEASRVAAETGRASSEAARQANEGTRQSQETARQTNTTDAINTLAAVTANTKHLGPYNDAAAYNPNNMVTYDGSTYMNIVACSNVPPTDAAHWVLAARKGDAGIGGGGGVGFVNVTAEPWEADPTGTTDSGAKINAAIAYAFDHNIHEVFIPSGTYILETPVVPRNDMSIRGAGRTTFLRVKNNTAISAIYSPVHVFNIMISHMTIDGNKQNNYDHWDDNHGLNLHMSSSTIEYVRFQNIRNTALKINDGQVDALGYLNKIQHNNIEDGWIGIKWGWRCTDSWCDYNNIGSEYANMFVQGGSCRFSFNHFDGSPEYNIILEGGNTVSFIGNIVENARKHGIYAPMLPFEEATRNLLISNNIIRSSSQEQSGEYDLIHLEGRETRKLDGIVIVGNQLVSDNSNPRHAVWLENAENATVLGNCFLGGYRSAPVHGVSTANVRIDGNIPLD